MRAYLVAKARYFERYAGCVTLAEFGVARVNMLTLITTSAPGRTSVRSPPAALWRGRQRGDVIHMHDGHSILVCHNPSPIILLGTSRTDSRLLYAAPEGSSNAVLGHFRIKANLFILNPNALCGTMLPDGSSLVQLITELRDEQCD